MVRMLTFMVCVYFSTILKFLCKLKKILNEEIKWFCFSSPCFIIISLALGCHMVVTITVPGNKILFKIFQITVLKYPTSKDLGYQYSLKYININVSRTVDWAVNFWVYLISAACFILAFLFHNWLANFGWEARRRNGTDFLYKEHFRINALKQSLEEVELQNWLSIRF